jgi:hypothetical protein
MSDETIPFGKHTGQLVSAVPVEYLLWALNRPGIPARHPAFYRAAARRVIAFLKGRLNDGAPLIRPHGRAQRFAVFTEGEVLAMRSGKGAT